MPCKPTYPPDEKHEIITTKEISYGDYYWDTINKEWCQINGHLNHQVFIARRKKDV